jgi:prepilin-type N-terminal cleavage/methylation domain-containing protein
MTVSKGFTLVELMVVIGIIAFITAIGVPTFNNVIADNRLTSTSNNLMGALQIARSEAVTQHTVIKVCATNADHTGCGDSTDWSAGVLIMKGSTVVKLIPSGNKNVTVASSRNDIEYQGNGTTSAATISITDTRGGAARTIKVNAIGQSCGGSTCS